MPSYRVSSLADDGTVDSTAALIAASDDAIADIACDMLVESKSLTAEVWDEARLVFRVCKLP
jgi:hypothetical protein